MYIYINFQYIYIYIYICINFIIYSTYRYNINKHACTRIMMVTVNTLLSCVTCRLEDSGVHIVHNIHVPTGVQMFGRADRFVNLGPRQLQFD